MKKIIIFLLMLNGIDSAVAQTSISSYPNEGDTIPNYTFKNIINHNGGSASTKEFLGKWLVLDWWATGCMGCVASFPKMNHLDQVFKDRVKLIMVGEYGERPSINGTKKFYLNQEKRHNLKMTAAFDSVSFSKFGIWATPFILVINPKGIIVAKTLYLDSAQLEGYISGKKLPYARAYSRGESPKLSYDINLPLLSTGKMSNGGIDTNTLFRSVLAKWNPEMPSGSSLGFEDNPQTNGIFKNEGKQATALGFDLRALLQIAYTGKNQWWISDRLYNTMSPVPILELKDKKLFDNSNLVTGENTWSYSLNTKNLNPKKAREFLLTDIERTFGFKTSLEKKSVVVWKLIVVDKTKAEKLETKSEKYDYNGIGAYEGFIIKNGPLSELVSSLSTPILFKEGPKIDWSYPPVLIDKTGLSFKIDLTLRANMTDIDDVKRALNKQGLDIIQEPYEMNCIVVRDADPSQSK